MSLIIFSPGAALKPYVETYTWYAATEPLHKYYIPASAYAHISLITRWRAKFCAFASNQPCFTRFLAFRPNCLPTSGCTWPIWAGNRLP